jgi:membrane-bound lytic murein transglycosylase B
LVALEQLDGDELWLGLTNFYVITRYNHSPLYAMAAYQLSQEIKQRR